MRLCFLAALVVGMLGIARATSADPVRIVTSGVYVVDFDSPGTWELIGDGFAFFGDGVGSVLPFWECGLCEPGTPISLDGLLELSPSSSSGSAALDGTRYETVWWTGRLEFESGEIPAGAGVRGSQPFQFSGALTGFLNPERTGPPLVSTMLTGSGTATLTFYPALTDGMAEVLEIRYDFAEPVPEPATLLLVGGGLAAAMRRRFCKKDDL